MRIRSLTQLFKSKAFSLLPTVAAPQAGYRPTPYLAHPFLQSVYNISEPLFPFKFERQVVNLEDGGNISLDWLDLKQKQNPPILFVMHGLTGGSEMNYIKELMKPAAQEGYCCVCLNSRGINNEMTSPLPFTGMTYDDLQVALEAVTRRHPNSQIYMVGTSFGGNYLMRYFLRSKPLQQVKALVTLAPPLDVGQTVGQMGSIYQRFFVKRYIQQTVGRHPLMNFWQECGLVDMKQVKASQNLMEFHTNLTARILKYPSAKQIFDEYTITDQEIQRLNVKTLIMLSKDDPIVSFKAMPLDSISKNPNIKLQVTERGGHLCWFEGFRPKRWYPKPVLQYFRQVRQRC